VPPDLPPFADPRPDEPYPDEPYPDEPHPDEPHPDDEPLPTQGDAIAELYAELRRLAQTHVGNEAITLQATVLVNETYLRLRDRFEWKGRAAFLSLASTAMRHIVVEHARRKRAEKRPPAEKALDFEAIVARYEENAHGLIALDAALEKLGEFDPALVRLVELRFFGGRSMDEIAEILGISPRQAARWWNTARGFLRRELDG